MLVMLQIRPRSQCHKIIFLMIVLLILFSWQYISAKVQCSAWFLSVAELPYRLTDCGAVAKGGCLVAGYFSVKASTVLKEGQRRARPNMKRRCISDFPLSTVWKFHQSQTVRCTIIGRNMH